MRLLKLSVDEAAVIVRTAADVLYKEGATIEFTEFKISLIESAVDEAAVAKNRAGDTGLIKFA